MSCTRPLRLFYTYPYQNGEGFTRYRTKVCSSKVDHLEETETGLWPVESEVVGSCRRVFNHWINVPCGKCPSCRLDQSRVWANRLMCEFAYHDPDKCWFVTLTYNDENVPVSYYCDDKTGEAVEVYSLRPYDCTKFIKDLRSYTDYRNDHEKIRFFLSGEYGERTKRPHYHAIFFNLTLDSSKLVFWKSSNKGFTLWRCPELEKIWSFGNVLVAKVSWATCAYVARYVAKKLGQTPYIYEKLNIDPEFSRMSRRPGIGAQWIADHPECIDQGIHLNLPDGARNFSAPRYFKELTFSKELDILHMDVHDRQSDYQDSVENVYLGDFQEFLETQEEGVVQSLSRSQRDFV